MGITNSNKELSASEIECGGSFQITLSLTGEPDIQKHPTDIVLILDRSGSMAGSPLANLKNGAKKFIEILDESSDGAKDGTIGGGSRIAIVSFSENATQDTHLITSVSDLTDAVNALSSSSFTNHADAFEKAVSLFDPSSENAKVMVMFTDGRTTAGDPPAPIAAAAKAQGIIIYCIGLSGNGGIDVSALNDWSSDPDSAYTVITPDEAELEEIFEKLAQNIAKPGATEIVLRDTVEECFSITSLNTPTKGSASLINENTVEWKIDALGVSKSESAVFTFHVRHTGICSGEIEVNASTDYSDKEKNVVSFPSPRLNVDCDIDVDPENCSEPIDIAVGGCSDAIEYHAGDLTLGSLGRILQLDVTLKRVCPDKRVALAVILNEVDDCGAEYRRGFKTLLVPAHTESTCKDITVRCINFVLPETLSVRDAEDSPCGDRLFRVRFLANYIDSDFECCPKEKCTR